jgi:hypothetical protein
MLLCWTDHRADAAIACQSFGCCYQPMGDDADFGAADKANGATPAIVKRVHQIVDLTNVPDDDVAGATLLLIEAR